VVSTNKQFIPINLHV